MHSETLYAPYTRHSIEQKLSDKQNAKVIYRFDRLRTAHSKRQKPQILEKLSATHEFDYQVLKANPGLISFKDLATDL